MRALPTLCSTLQDGKQIVCDEAFSLLKPHDHDHGAVETPVQFEEAQFDIETHKFIESMEDESSMRASKKPKVGANKRNDRDDTMADQLPSCIMGADTSASVAVADDESNVRYDSVSSDNKMLQKVSNSSGPQDDVKDVTLDDKSLEK
jgi:hypothetical protein